MPSFDDEVSGRKIPAFFDKYSRPGERHGGPLKAEPIVSQEIDYVTKELKFFKSGEPRWQYVMEIATDLRDPAVEGDDGTRRIYVKGRNKKRLKDVIATAGLKTLRPGDEVWDTYASEHPETKEKIHTYEVKAGPNAQRVGDAQPVQASLTPGDTDTPPF